ncbi:MAG: hypothetical protein NT003_04475 [Candidatus Magasanikbacteria bacterium]|nr:hypothetical protein [Candidatus Magasanikbacteria bacterium]
MKITFKPFWLQAILNFVNAGFTGILLFHFYKQHVGLSDIFFADAIGCSINALSLFARRSIHIRRDIQIGFGVLALSLIFLMIVPYSKPIFYIFYAFQTIGGIIFYVPLNILFFEKISPTERMRSMTAYWIVGIIAGVIGPIIGAFLFTHTGSVAFLSIPLAILLIGIYIARFAPADIVRYTPTEVLSHIKTLRTINLLDGALHRVSGDVGLFALLFVSTVVDYGNYLSFVSLIMVGISWIIAKKSDSSGKRMKFLWPSAVIAGIATMSFSFAHTFVIFIILTIITRSALIIAEPLRSNVMQDILHPHPINWISREFYLNVGRAIIQVIAAILLFYGSPVAAFILFGAMHMAFPLLVRWKKIYHIPPTIPAL